jgi:CheY-like chemotaxis protein
MRPSLGSARILVAGDGADEAEQLSKLLKKEFEYVRTSTRMDSSVRDFETHRPHVLLLGFHTLEKAQRYYSELQRLSKIVHEHSHGAIILCSKEEIRAAFELCKDHYFDDYVPYWPYPYDGTRLVMSILTAARAVIGSQRQLSGESECTGEDLHRDEPGPGPKAQSGVPKEAAQTSGEQDRNATIDWSKLPDGEARDKTHCREPAGDSAGKLNHHIDVAQTRPSAPAKDIAGSRPILMIIEDDEFTQELLSRSLDPAAYEILFFDAGAQAIRELERVRPDVILMDIKLPDTDGISLTRLLKSVPGLASIPVIMVTGDSRRETFLTSIEAGADDFIAKPFSSGALQAKLDRALRR